MVPSKKLKTLYFGGGTPSLISENHLSAMIKKLKSVGFTFEKDHEVTIEINPGTLTEEKLKKYLQMGINRFSVGVQTFQDSHLKNCGREHSAEQTRQTLKLLKKHNLNFSADILFSLPHQTFDELKKDVEEVLHFDPAHVSAYFLTVPKNHKMSFHRPVEEEQIKMYEWIENSLKKKEIYKYEISNFSKKEKESKHNQLYWSDQAYWGIGLSSHSYFPQAGEWGVRFWNSKTMKDYEKTLDITHWKGFSKNQKEVLKKEEAMTDFFHMFLRTTKGVNTETMRHNFEKDLPEINKRLQGLLEERLLEEKFSEESLSQYCLTKKGQLLSNVVFQKLTFTE